MIKRDNKIVCETTSATQQKIVVGIDRTVLHLLSGVEFLAKFGNSHLPTLLVVVDLDQNFAKRRVHRFRLFLDEIDLYL